MLSLLVVSSVSAGCSASDEATTTTDEPVPGVPDELAGAPAEDLVDDSPFCRTMLEVGADDAGGTLDDLIAVYADLRPDVPERIRPQFDIVLERMVSRASGADVADPALAEEAAIELSAFIEAQCRGTAMNPLPPPTVPGEPAAND